MAPVYEPIRFSLESVPNHTFLALSYGATWNGTETLIVDKATLDQMLTVSGEPRTQSPLRVHCLNPFGRSGRSTT